MEFARYSCLVGLSLGAGLNQHPGGDASKPLKAKLRCIFLFFYLLGINHLRFAEADEPRGRQLQNK